MIAQAEQTAATPPTGSKPPPPRWGATAGPDRGMLVTGVLAVLLTMLAMGGLWVFVGENTWVHDFFFKRQFVQWLLLALFFFGLLNTLRHLPSVRRDRLAAREIASYGFADPDQLTTRWQRLARIDHIADRDALSAWLVALKEQLPAEIDRRYRIASDAIQLLPLLGFFGTVFGLSIGLYDTFLVQGNTNSRGFASAIAIAFDNTLLGLGLTIVLFSVNTVIRKMDEAVCGEIEAFGNERLRELTIGAGRTQPRSLESGLARFATIAGQLQQALPKTVEQIDRVTLTLEQTSEALTESIDRQAAIVLTLIEVCTKVKESAEVQARLERLIKDLPEAHRRAEDRFAKRLQAAIKQLNDDLVRGVVQALRQPRSIVITQTAEPAEPEPAVSRNGIDREESHGATSSRA